MNLKANKEGDFQWLVFDSRKELEAFTNERITKLSDSNHKVWQETCEGSRTRMRNAGDAKQWFGSEVSSFEELEDHNEFAHLYLLEKAEASVDKHLAPFLDQLSEQEYQQETIAFHPKIGVFSFDRAAMGLHKIKTEEGKTKVVTSVKDCFAYFTEKCVTKKAVKLYLIAGAAAGTKGEEMLYAGVGVALLTEFLERRGIGVEINLLLGSSSRNKNYYTVCRIKKTEDTLDKNSLLLMSSDPKWFRYKGFKTIVAIYDFFGKKIPSGLGKLKREPIHDFVEKQKDNDTTASYLFGMSYSLQEAIAEVKRIANSIKEK